MKLVSFASLIAIAFAKECLKLKPKACKAAEDCSLSAYRTTADKEAYPGKKVKKVKKCHEYDLTGIRCSLFNDSARYCKMEKYMGCKWQKDHCSKFTYYGGYKSHSAAQEFCKSKGKKLAIACTKIQFDEILEINPEKRSIWLNGYRDTYRTSNEMRWDGVLPWDDASCTNENWAAGEPNDAGYGEGCAELRTDVPGKESLNDVPCNFKRAVVCEAIVEEF